MLMNRLTSRLTGSRRAHLLVFPLLIAAPLFANAVGCKSASEKQESKPPTAVTAASDTVKVTVNNEGFVPGAIRAKQSQPLTLVFTRTSDQTCATQVAFPELNVTKDLPLNTPVSVQVPTDKARTLTFQCGMGMYKSSVVISES
jgi:plastocyanin domain-containing protein